MRLEIWLSLDLIFQGEGQVIIFLLRKRLSYGHLCIFYLYLYFFNFSCCDRMHFVESAYEQLYMIEDYQRFHNFHMLLTFSVWIRSSNYYLFPLLMIKPSFSLGRLDMSPIPQLLNSDSGGFGPRLGPLTALHALQSTPWKIKKRVNEANDV